MSPSIGEKLGAVLTLIVAMTKGAFVIVRSPFYVDPQAQKPLKREVDRIMGRTLVEGLSPAQIHWVLPSSTAAYESWIAKKAKIEGAPAQVVTELIGDDGAKLHWIGRSDAKKVILHFHSGGFVMPLHNGHISLINYFRCEIKRRSGVEVKAAFLEYTLAPLATYPTQYQQAVRAVHHVLNSGTSPADILISGDSAGGTLVMQIMSQYLHPHPSISALPIPPVPFAGFLVTSPWVTFDVNAPSFQNNDRDCLTPVALLRWGPLMRQGKTPPDSKGQPEEYWQEPLKAPEEWWNGTESVTKHVMFVTGEWEVLRDDVLSLVAKFEKGTAGKVDVVAAEEAQGTHIAPFLDAMNGRPLREMAKTMADWVHDRLV